MKLEILNALDTKGLIKEVGASSNKEVIASHLSKLKLPNKKSEKYRYFDIEEYLNKDLELLTTKKDNFEITGNKLVIENGSILKAPKVDGLEVKIDSFSDVDNDHFDSLYYASHLFAKDVIKIYISKDCKFEIEHIFNKDDFLINYRVAIFVDTNVNATIYESFKNEANSSKILAGYDIFVSPYANFELIKNQTLNQKASTPIFSNYYKVDSNANFKLGTFDFANSNFLNIFKAELFERAEFMATHLLYTNGDIKGGTVSEIVHIGKHSKSNQVAKNILNNNSRGIFDALIRVTNSASGTIAHQNSKAILLQSGAYMASKPQLEIYIDDLQASHGSTTGQLDEKALFYLRSRGIKEVEAKKMLILAFANEAINSVRDELFANHIYVDFERAYYGSAELDCMKTCHSCEDMILKD